MNSANPLHAAARGTGSAALMCALAEEHGLSLARAIAGTGIDEAALRDPDAEITAEQEVRLVATLAAELPETAGLVTGTRYRLATYGIWGFALLSSRTLREGHQVAMRFVDLTYALTRISAAEDSEQVSVFFDDLDVPEPVRRFVLLRDTAAALQLWRESLGQTVVPRHVELSLPEPADPAPYEATFGVRPRFAAPRSVLAFDATLLDQPLPQAAPLTAALCEAQCRVLLERRQSRRGVSGQVRDLLLRGPQRMPRQEDVAATLHMSVRTLRRHLEDEGTSFRAVVDQVRRHLAEELLVTVGLSVEQVAARLGYSEASAFVHAFRRWTGVSPRRWADTAGASTRAAPAASGHARARSAG